ncbi:MAG: polyhydroxybutyrate depolymerase [Pseudomonadota bacterium]
MLARVFFVQRRGLSVKSIRSIGLAAILVASAMFVASAQPADACGPDTDCQIGDRTYRIRMPENHDGQSPVGAIMYMHGWRGSAAGVMKNGSLGKAVSDLGLALIAPKSYNQDWDIQNSPSQVGLYEIDFFDRLLTDVTQRFPIDPDRIMATGFSAGGMMTWTLACERGDRFVGFAPIAGTFWAPVPESCPSAPVHLMHVHGTTDTMVPLGGRPIADTAQGDVMEALAMFASAGEFTGSDVFTEGELRCDRKTNPAGKILELCLHDGGHSFRTEYVVRAWRQLEALNAF